MYGPSLNHIGRVFTTALRTNRSISGSVVKSLESISVDTDVDGTGFRRKDLWIN